MADRYARNAGAVFTLKYHLVWCPKYRRKVLTGRIEVRLRQLLAEVADEKGMMFHAMEIMPDHVHLFVESDPTLCVAEIVNRLKGRSSRVLRQEFPTLRSRLPTLWSRNYYAGTVGQVSRATVKRYIESQKGKSLIRSYKYRLYPNGAQEAALSDMPGHFRDLYNAGLQQRIEAWNRQGVSLGYAARAGELRAVRDAVPELAGYSFSAEQQVLRRLDKAFAAFFRRVKAGETPGFPRFRAKSRFHSADFRVGDGLVCRDGRLRLVGIPGLVKVRWHRELPARPSHAIVSCSNGKGYVTLQFTVRELRIPGEEDTRPDVGIDVGLNSIVATSDGESVAAPKPARKAQRKTRRLQRALARKDRRSKQRAKARRNLAGHHARVAAGRRDFLHKLSHGLASRHRVIAMEELGMDALKRSFLARSVHDAAWTQLRDMLTYKAESAGGSVVLVDPHGTSRRCSGCGAEPDRPKTLADRVHDCDGCGLVLDRDVNAARNVLQQFKGPGTGLRSRSVRVAA